jgi:hypothetical protein
MPYLLSWNTDFFMDFVITNVDWVCEDSNLSHTVCFFSMLPIVQVGWSANASDLYSGDDRFESLPVTNCHDRSFRSIPPFPLQIFRNITTGASFHISAVPYWRPRYSALYILGYWQLRSIYSLSLSPSPTLDLRASVKRFVSLQFLNPKIVGRTPWMGDQPVARPLPTQTQNKRSQTSMS